MQESELYREFMKGVNVQAASDEFWAGVASSPMALRDSVAQSLQASRPRTSRFRPGSAITPSTHRPPVVASDRLLTWSTPAGLEWQTDLEHRFPDSSLFRLFQVHHPALYPSFHSNVFFRS